MPVYNFKTSTNYGDGDAQSVAIRAFLGLGRWRADDSVRADGYYFDCEETSGNLEPSGAASWGYYMSPALGPDYCSMYNGFKCSQAIHIDTTTALPIGYTIELDVSNLDFLTPDQSDRAVLYWDGSDWTEIDSWVGDLGRGRRLYFATQAALAASNTFTTYYRLVWRSPVARALETDRDNIFVFWDDFINMSAWTVVSGTWVITNNTLEITGSATSPRIRITDAPTPDDMTIVTIQYRTGAKVLKAGPVLEWTPSATGVWNLADETTSQIVIRDIGIASSTAAYTYSNGETYVQEYKKVGSDYWARNWIWGNDIPSFQVTRNTATAGTHTGLRAETSSNDTHFYSYYIMLAVTTGPTVTLGGPVTDYRNYYGSRFKQLVYNGSSSGDLEYYHSTAGLSPDGMVPTCLRFDGTDDYVDCGSDSSLNPTADALSIEFLIYFDRVQDYKYVVYKDLEYRVRTRNNGGDLTIEYGVYVGGAWRINNIAAWTTGLILHTWNHIECVYDGAEIRVSVNGIEQPGSFAQVGNINTTANNLYLGNDNAGSNYIDAMLDGLKIYDGVLHTANFTAPQQSDPPPIEEDDTMALYYFDETSGGYIYDKSGNANTGAIYGYAEFYWDGYGWCPWVMDVESDNIGDLLYIDPPNETYDSAKNYFYRFKVVFNHNTTSIDYIDTYYQGEVTEFLRKVDRRQDPKEVIGGQALMNFTATLANASIPGTEQDYDRFFNFDSDISGFSQYLDSGGCFSVQVGYRNEQGVVDYWRPYLDDLKSNMRGVEQSDDGTVTIRGTIGKNLTKNTIDMPLVENIRHDNLIEEYLIKDDTLSSPDTEYDQYYCDFVNETGEKTLTVLNEFVSEAVICPDWGADPITGDKDDESIWYLMNMHVHASCTDEKYLYVAFKTAMEHLGSGSVSCIQVRRCNKDGTPVEDGVVGNIFCDKFGGLGWDDTNTMVAGGICTDDDYVYVTYWEEDGNGVAISVIGRLKKTGQNLYGHLGGAYPGANQSSENRIYYDQAALFADLIRLNGCTKNANNLYYFSYDPGAAPPAAGGKFQYYDVTEIGDWDGGAFTRNTVRDYGVGGENIRGFGLAKDDSAPGGNVYRCTIKDFDDSHSYLTTMNIGTGVVDQNTTTGTATDTTSIWDDGATVEYVWNITILGQYIYASIRDSEYTEGDQPEGTHPDARGIGKFARYGFWLESGHIQCAVAPYAGLTDYKVFPYPLIKVGGEQLSETPTSLPMTDEFLDTDDYILDLYSGEIWFDKVPGADSKTVPSEIYVLESNDEVKRLLDVRAYYEFKPCIQYFKAEKDTERWQAIQDVCDAAGYICSPSSNGMLKFRDRYTEEIVELADGYELEHEIMYDEGDNDWIDDGDAVDARIQFVGEDDDGLGGTNATEAWIEFTAFKDMLVDRIAVYLLPIMSDGSDGDFPNAQYSEGLAIDIEMGQMHAVNDHAWATAGTKVKDEWYIPYEDRANPHTPLRGHWYYIDLDTQFSCTSGVTYGIRFTVDTAVTALQGFICNWAIGMDNSKTDAVTRYSILDGTGAWTNDDNHAACRLYSAYEEEYLAGSFGDTAGNIVYSEWQEYQRYIEMTFTPSRDVAADEIIEIAVGDVDFPTLVTDGYIQSNGYDLRVGYSSDGITYHEIPRVALHLTDADNAKVYFAAQEVMTNGLAYPQTYRLYISNPNAGAPPENVGNMIFDRFNDRDITGGDEDDFNWTTASGTWYNNYQLMRINSGAVRQLFINDEMENWNGQDMVVEADVWHTGTGNYQVGVVFRYQDNNNYIAAFLDEDDDEVQLKAMHGGVWAGGGFEDSAAFVHGANTIYRLRVRTVDDDHEVYIDGTKYIDYTMNFGDSDTFDEGGLFAGGGATERMDNFIAYVYYGAQPAISSVTTRMNNMDVEYDTIKVIPYNRKEVYERNTDYYLSIRDGSLYIRRTTGGSLDDGDYIYAIHELAPVYDVDAKTKLTRSDDKYGNSVVVIGRRRFVSDVPLTVIKYIDIPPRKATDDPINLTTAATKMQRVFGSKQADWRDDRGEFEEDVDLSAFGADFEFDEPYIVGDPVTVAIYGDPSEWFGIYEVPFNYPLPAGFDNGSWDGEEVWDLTAGPPPVAGDLYFKAVRTGYAGEDGDDFIYTIPPQSIRIGNYKEWRKRLGAMYYTGGPPGGTVVFDDGNGLATYGGDGWYWRLKHMNDNYGGYGTKLLYYPHRIEVLSASTSTYEELVRQQRKDLYIEVTPIDELGAVMFDDDAVDPNSGAIADEHKVHVFAIEPSSDGVKIRAANRTGTDQRLRVKISGYQANIKKIIQVRADDQDEIDAQGQRKLPDYENEFITSHALAYRRAHEILALGVDEEQFLRDVPFSRLHLDAEVHDTVSLTDKDNRIYKALFKLLGINDTITIDGISQSKAPALMRLRYQ